MQRRKGGQECVACTDALWELCISGIGIALVAGKIWGRIVISVVVVQSIVSNSGIDMCYVEGQFMKEEPFQCDIAKTLSS